MPKKAPRPRPKRRRPRAWWTRNRRELLITAVVCLGTSAFLAATVSSFDVDEIKEIGAVATIVLAALKIWKDS